MNQKHTTGNQKIILIAAAAVVVFAGAFILLYLRFAPKSVQGSKDLTVTVVDSEGKEQHYQVKTDAQYLRQALEEIDGLKLEGTEGDYGIYVDAVNGIRADYEKDGAYWAFYVNGEYCNYAIEEQPVYDQDTFTIKYETGMQ